MSTADLPAVLCVLVMTLGCLRMCHIEVVISSESEWGLGVKLVSCSELVQIVPLVTVDSSAVSISLPEMVYPSVDSVALGNRSEIH